MLEVALEGGSAPGYEISHAAQQRYENTFKMGAFFASLRLT